MRERPRLLDLFCCEGGAGLGYQLAGFEVVGWDLLPQPRYPHEFHQGDALDVLADRAYVETFDAIHTSPPCPHASAGTRAVRKRGKEYPRLIEPVRELLSTYDVPWVIENVAGSALVNPLRLCGTEFGLTTTDDDGTPLELRRHRHFESNVLLLGAGGCRHTTGAQVAGSYGGARRDKDEARHVRHGGYVPSADVQRRLLGTPWMTEHGCQQSIPPAYSEWIGQQLLAAVEVRRAA